jgi:hypothetical protein
MNKPTNLSIVSLRRRKQQLLKRLKLPADALPGSLSSSKFRCGKASCHCRDGEGHQKWVLNYMSDGSKRVKHIPSELVEYVRQKIEEGKTFKEGLNEIFGANVEMLDLLRDHKKQRS